MHASCYIRLYVLLGPHFIKACSMGRQLVHLDIKSPNVLLQDKVWLVAKIADLGISKYLVEGSLLDFTFRGVSMYLHVYKRLSFCVACQPVCLALFCRCEAYHHIIATIACVLVINSESSCRFVANCLGLMNCFLHSRTQQSLLPPCYNHAFGAL